MTLQFERDLAMIKKAHAAGPRGDSPLSEWDQGYAQAIRDHGIEAWRRHVAEAATGPRDEGLDAIVAAVVAEYDHATHDDYDCPGWVAFNELVIRLRAALAKASE